jgi:hypothetical protein
VPLETFVLLSFHALVLIGNLAVDWYRAVLVPLDVVGAEETVSLFPVNPLSKFRGLNHRRQQKEGLPCLLKLLFYCPFTRLS